MFGISAVACDRSPAVAAGPRRAASVAAVTPTTAPTEQAPVTTAEPEVAASLPSDGEDAETTKRESTDPTTGKARVPHAAIKAGEVGVMTIKELGNFDFDPNKDGVVPADVQALNGSMVRLRGFMLALTQATNITDFALMPTLGNCCYGVPAGVQHTITCRIPKSKALNYVMDEVSVEGKLTVHVKREDGYTYSIFELDVTSVKLAQ